MDHGSARSVVADAPHSRERDKVLEAWRDVALIKIDRLGFDAHLPVAAPQFADPQDFEVGIFLAHDPAAINCVKCASNCVQYCALIPAGTSAPLNRYSARSLA